MPSLANEHRTSAMYERMLADPDLASLTIERIARYALTHDVTALLGKLCGHPGLPGHLDEQLAKIDKAAVRRRWIARPGRAPEAIVALLDGETRSAPLQAAAECLGLPEAAYRQVLEHGNEKVWCLLADNPSLPASLYSEVAARIAALPLTKSPWKARHRWPLLRALSWAAPDAAPAVIAVRPPVPALLAVVDSPYLGEEHVGQMIEALAQLKVGTSQHQGPTPDHDYGLLREFASLVESLASHRYLTPNARTSLAALADAWRPLFKGGNRVELVDPNRVKRSAAASCTPSLDSASGVAQAVGQACATGDQALAAQLLGLPSDRITKGQCEQLASRVSYEAKSSVLSAHRGDPEHLGLLVALLGGSDDIVGRCVDPQAALQSAMRHMATLGSVPHWLLKSSLLTGQVLLEAPASLLTARQAPGTQQLLNQVIAERLGGDNLAWDVFETLLESFDGSIDELLVASVGLAAGS